MNEVGTAAHIENDLGLPLMINSLKHKVHPPVLLDEVSHHEQNYANHKSIDHKSIE